LCHAGADKAWVEELGSRLEAEHISNRSIQVFLDKWDVDYGENLVAKIDEALSKARFCAVVLSPAMLKRDWPLAEWTAVFTADPAGRRQQILPMLLHDRDPETGELCEIPCCSVRFVDSTLHETQTLTRNSLSCCGGSEGKGPAGADGDQTHR